MATLARAPRDADQPRAERRFYFAMSLLIAAIVLAGFGGYALTGISSFAAPWWVHLHAVSYMAWIVLYVNQNALVVGGNIARHQRIGMAMAALAVWLVIIGYVLLYASVAAHRSPPPVFTAGMLFAMDGLGILVFTGLVGWGLAMRAHTDWHRRLMLAATVQLIHPAFGRVLVLTIGFSWLRIVIALLALLGIAAAFDWRTRGRVHPALMWGGAVIALYGLIVPPLSTWPPLVALAEAVAGG